MEEDRNAFKILIHKSAEKRTLGWTKRRWEDKIRMYNKEIDVIARNWADSAQDKDYWTAHVNAALNLRIP